MKLLTSKEIRKTRVGWKEFISQNRPYRYMLTLTFRYDDITDEKAVKSMNLLIHFLNRKLFGTKYKTKNKCLRGFVVAERQEKRIDKNQSEIHKYINNSKAVGVNWGDRGYSKRERKLMHELWDKPRRLAPHFHILIKDDQALKNIDFEELVMNYAMKVKSSSKKSKQKNDIKLVHGGSSIFDVQGVDVSEIYDDYGIAKYLTKTLKGRTDKIGDCIESLTKTGTHFIITENW